MRMVILDPRRRKQARNREPQAVVSASVDEVVAPDSSPE
jgi:hypothetical protein